MDHVMTITAKHAHILLEGYNPYRHAYLGRKEVPGHTKRIRHVGLLLGLLPFLVPGRTSNMTSLEEFTKAGF